MYRNIIPNDVGFVIYQILLVGKHIYFEAWILDENQRTPSYPQATTPPHENSEKKMVHVEEMNIIWKPTNVDHKLKATTQPTEKLGKKMVTSTILAVF